MSAFYKDADHTATEEESVAVIHKAIELGVTLLDTSDIYGMRWHIHHHLKSLKVDCFCVVLTSYA